MKKGILQYVQYNLWANKIIADVITEKAIDFLDNEIPNSFPSLRKTLLHIWDAENIWFTRLNNLPITDWPSKDVSKHASVLQNIISQSEAFLMYVESKDEAWLNTNIEYTNIKPKLINRRRSMSRTIDLVGVIPLKKLFTIPHKEVYYNFLCGYAFVMRNLG